MGCVPRPMQPIQGWFYSPVDTQGSSFFATLGCRIDPLRGFLEDFCPAPLRRTRSSRWANKRGPGFAKSRKAKGRLTQKVRAHQAIEILDLLPSVLPVSSGVDSRFPFADQGFLGRQPFTPPSWMPEMSCFCITTNRMMSGTTFMTVAAMISSVCWPYCP